MKVNSIEERIRLKKKGKLKAVGREKVPKTDSERAVDVLHEISTNLKAVLLKEDPAPIVNVAPAPVKIPEQRKIKRFDVKRDSKGFTESLIPIYE